MKDPETELKLINASYDADYLAYMVKHDIIHGKYDVSIVADGDSLVIDGHKVALSYTRDPAGIPFSAREQLARCVITVSFSAPAAVNYGFSVPCPLLCASVFSICCGELWVLSPMPAPSHSEPSELIVEPRPLCHFLHCRHQCL